MKLQPPPKGRLPVTGRVQDAGYCLPRTHPRRAQVREEALGEVTLLSGGGAAITPEPSASESRSPWSRSWESPPSFVSLKGRLFSGPERTSSQGPLQISFSTCLLPLTGGPGERAPHLPACQGDVPKRGRREKRLELPSASY